MVRVWIGAHSCAAAGAMPRAGLTQKVLARRLVNPPAGTLFGGWAGSAQEAVLAKQAIQT